MSGSILHRIFNATPPALKKGAVVAPPAAVTPPPPPAEIAIQGTKVQSYLDRCAEEALSVTGVSKYLVKLERDDFNRRNQLPTPTGVERYLASGQGVARASLVKGPTGVEKYLSALAAA